MLSTSRSWLRLGGLTALASVALVSPAAHAAPPAESDFFVLYFITDENGERDRQMSSQDMQLFVNQARCECNQQIATRITFQGSDVDAVQINGYIGRLCDQAQQSLGIGNNKLCAQFVSGLPQTFQTSPEYTFSPIWLAYGVEGSDQNINAAAPAGTCTGGQEGQGGLWMCAGATACMQGDFFMTGTANANIPEGESAAGISFDYLSPVGVPTDFKASPGDSAVQISWSNPAPGDIAGYRILCADESGNPVDNGVSFSPPSPTSIVNGTIYYTANNLCPDGPFGVEDTGDGDGDPTGDGDGDPTGDGDGDPGCVDGELGCACLADPADTCNEGLACVDGLCCTPGDNDCSCADDGMGNLTECSTPGASCNADTGVCECPEGAEGCACVGGLGGTCNDAALSCNDAGECVSGLVCPTGTVGCACNDDGTCEPGLECSDIDTCATVTDGIYTLDWSYVCSDHLAFNSTSARISGLENGREYTFLVVAYDRAGNPVFGDTISARPVPTNGLWEQCEAQGDVCGEGWSCAVVDTPGVGGFGWLLGGLGLGGLGLGLVARRRRRRG